MNRRKLIGGLGLLVAAPAIVKVSNIMPVKAWDDTLYFTNDGAFTINLPEVNQFADLSMEIRVDTQPVVFTSHYPMVVTRDGVAVLDVPPGVINLKPGDRVQMIVHDRQCRPFSTEMTVARDYRPLVVQKGIFGWREL
jgi:hypothetical protein